jgi:hypothetical protein
LEESNCLLPNKPPLELDGVKLNGDGLAVLDDPPNPPNDEVNGFGDSSAEVAEDFSAGILSAELVIALSFNTFPGVVVADGKLNKVGAAFEDGLAENALKGFEFFALLDSDEPPKDSVANGFGFSLAAAVVFVSAPCSFDLVLSNIPELAEPNEEKANCSVVADEFPNDRDENGFGSAFRSVPPSFCLLSSFDKLNRFVTADVDSDDGFSDSDANGLIDFDSSAFLQLLLAPFFEIFILVLEDDDGP